MAHPAIKTRQSMINLHDPISAASNDLPARSDFNGN
jgi:hypothetical protein